MTYSCSGSFLLRSGEFRLPALHWRGERKPLPMTSKLKPMSETTAVHIVASPMSARTMNPALTPSANIMLWLSIVAMVQVREASPEISRESSYIRAPGGS